MTIFRRDLGPMDYGECWRLQQTLFDRLLACKHPATARPSREVREEGDAPEWAHRRNDTEGAHRRNSTDGPQRKNSTEAAAPEENYGKERTDGAASEVRTPQVPRTETETTAGTILFVEHPHVYTLGKSGHAENLLVGRPELERSGAKFFHIDRGGDITYHGPGQLVCYPILDLEKLGIGLRDYIEALEEAVIRTVAHYGIRGGRIAGASGVWIAGPSVRELAQADHSCDPQSTVPHAGIPRENTRPRKICAIGVRSSRFITMHGFALNVTTDLGRFACINPCGFTDRGVTSIAAETGREVPPTEVADLVVEHLKEILNVKIYKY